MQKLVPVSIFTGFLGSGKTTLINHLIKEYPDRKIGVIINEFGEIGIDSDLIQTDEELKIEVSNGCACCVVRGDLERGVQKMLETIPDLDNLFVEASGLAEPEPIVNTFVHNLSFNKVSYLDAVICCIDGQQFVQNWNEFETLHKQVAYSDFIVLTISSESEENLNKIKEILKAIRPDHSLIHFEIGKDNREITQLIGKSLSEIETAGHSHSHEESEVSTHSHSHDHDHHHEDFDEVVFRTSKPLDPIKLDAVFLEEPFTKLVRAKGFLNFPQQEDISFVFQLVGHGRQLSPFHEKRPESVLVLIGKNIDEKKVISSLESCISH